MRTRWASALALVPLLAFADPIADVRNGTDLFLNNVKATVDGDTGQASGFLLRKAPGTLDLDLTLADFGLNDSQPIHAAASVSGNVITWTFDKTFSPRVAIDGSTDLRHAWGTVKATAEMLSPNALANCYANHCDRNVKLNLAAGTVVHVAGEGALGFDFNEVVDVQRIKAVGGVARPTLLYFVMPSGVYQSYEEQTIYPYIELNGVAPNGGATVEMWSGAPGATFATPHLVVPQGQTWISAPLKLAANFSGNFQVRASSGGVRSTQRFIVGPRPDTDHKNNPFDKKLWVPDAAAGCLRCSVLVARPGEDVSIGMVSSIPSLIEKTRVTPLTTIVNAQSVNPANLSSAGWLTGTLTNARGTFGFVSNVKSTLRQTVLLGADLSPVTVNARGLVLANDRTGHAGTILRRVFKPLAMPSGTRSTVAVAMNDTGVVVGTRVDVLGLSSGFVHRDGAATTLTGLSGNAFKPVAVNNAGEIAGNSGGLAVRNTQQSGTRSLGMLSGYTGTVATGQNELGWVVGTASTRAKTTGFLWTKSDGMLDLNAFSPSPRFVVLEALSVTNDKQIVVRALSDGNEDLYVLSF